MLIKRVGSVFSLAAPPAEISRFYGVTSFSCPLSRFWSKFHDRYPISRRDSGDRDAWQSVHKFRKIETEVCNSTFET